MRYEFLNFSDYFTLNGNFLEFYINSAINVPIDLFLVQAFIKKIN